MKIEIIKTTASNGDCDLGCWNEGNGAIIKIDDVTVFAKEAWASCCDNSEISETEILQELLKALKIDATITVEGSHNDDYDDDYYEDDE